MARGDLSRKITVDINGEVLELKDTITIVDQRIRPEVTRVARGGDRRQAGVSANAGVAGTQDLTDSVNSMPTIDCARRNIAEVATAVLRGDLSRKIAVDVKGEYWSSRTRSTQWSTNYSFAGEDACCRRGYGRPPRRAGRRRRGGTWRDLTDNVNMPAEPDYAGAQYADVTGDREWRPRNCCRR